MLSTATRDLLSLRRTSRSRCKDGLARQKSVQIDSEPSMRICPILKCNYFLANWGAGRPNSITMTSDDLSLVILSYANVQISQPSLTNYGQRYWCTDRLSPSSRRATERSVHSIAHIEARILHSKCHFLSAWWSCWRLCSSSPVSDLSRSLPALLSSFLGGRGRWWGWGGNCAVDNRPPRLIACRG